MTSTAGSLHMTRPRVTTRVRKLEAQLGYELFERKGRSLRRASLPGGAFVEEAIPALDHLQLADEWSPGPCPFQ